MELYAFTKKIFWKTFVQYVTVWLVRIWIYKNADKEVYTFSWKSKNVKKKTDKRGRKSYSVKIHLLVFKAIWKENTANLVKNTLVYKVKNTLVFPQLPNSNFRPIFFYISMYAGAYLGGAIGPWPPPLGR